MRLVFAGTPDVAVPTLVAITASAHDLVGVVTRPDAPAGRGRTPRRSPVGDWADARGIEVMTPQRPRDPDFLGRLKEIGPDCVPVVAYGALVPPAALDIPRYGWVNLHFSLLPAWRGAAPVPHALLHGDELTGASVFALDEGLDTGPIYGTLTERIRPRDTAGDVLSRLATDGAALLVDVLDGIEAGLLAARPQPHEGVSLAPKLHIEDARIRWSEPAFAVDRRVRACTPAPGGWCQFRGERLKIGPVTPSPPQALEDGEQLTPGQVLVDRRRVTVGTGSEPVILGEVQPPGKRPVPAVAWARGARVASGEVFA